MRTNQIRPLGEVADAQPIASTEKQLPWYKRRIVQAVGAVAAVGTLVGIGMQLGGGNEAPQRAETSTSAATNPEDFIMMSDPGDVLNLQPGEFASMSEQEQYNTINDYIVPELNGYMNDCVKALNAGVDLSEIPYQSFADSATNPVVLDIQDLARQIVAAKPEGEEYGLGVVSVGEVSSERDIGDMDPQNISNVTGGPFGTFVSVRYSYDKYGFDGDGNKVGIIKQGESQYLDPEYTGATLKQDSKGNLIFITTQ